MRAAALALALLLMVAAPARATGPAADPAVAYLLTQVETSTLTFVRNGAAYTGPQAADHMRKKAAYFRRRIHAPEDFIRLAATKSELTGKPYLVQVSRDTTVPCDAWLRGLLARYRRAHRAAP